MCTYGRRTYDYYHCKPVTNNSIWLMMVHVLLHVFNYAPAPLAFISYCNLHSTALIVTLAWQMQCLRVNNGEANGCASENTFVPLCVCVCDCAPEVVRIMVDTFNCGPAAALTHTHTQWAVQWWVETKKASIKQPKPQMLFDVNRTENKTEIAEKREVLLIALWLGNKIK